MSVRLRCDVDIVLAEWLKHVHKYQEDVWDHVFSCPHLGKFHGGTGPWSIVCSSVENLQHFRNHCVGLGEKISTEEFLKDLHTHLPGFSLWVVNGGRPFDLADKKTTEAVKLYKYIFIAVVYVTGGTFVGQDPPLGGDVYHVPRGQVFLGDDVASGVYTWIHPGLAQPWCRGWAPLERTVRTTVQMPPLLFSPPP